MGSNIKNAEIAQMAKAADCNSVDSKERGFESLSQLLVTKGGIICLL